MIRHVAFPAEPAEPGAGEVQMHLLAETALGSDPEAIADDQHADRQLGVDRGSPDLSLERSQLRAQARQILDPVDRAQKVIGRDVPLQAELVEQRFLRHPPLAHHHAALHPGTA